MPDKTSVSPSQTDFSQSNFLDFLCKIANDAYVYRAVVVDVLVKRPVSDPITAELIDISEGLARTTAGLKQVIAHVAGGPQ